MAALELESIQEEEAHYSLITDRLDGIIRTVPAISANDSIIDRLEDLKGLVEGWHRSVRAVEMRLRIPED